jgi:Flp pilus assembly CpaF family ATPase
MRKGIFKLKSQDTEKFSAAMAFGHKGGVGQMEALAIKEALAQMEALASGQNADRQPASGGTRQPYRCIA